MDKNAIKTFSINARKRLIADIKLKASMLGITEDGILDKLSTSTSEIEYYVDDRNPITGSEIQKRRKLVLELNQRTKDNDFKAAFDDLVEEIAYTWFNRLIAIRFMEVNDYLPSRTAVLSSTQGRHEPDIMMDPLSLKEDFGVFISEERALISKAKETEATVDMDRLYRMLFIKQVNALNANLPYLFEKTDDYAELLFTPNYHDGVIQHLITDIPVDDFDVTAGGQVEIIGWLYQYYNMEPKDAAFKKKKYTESDIPAVTQLFTPDWIVKYMVENSLGRYWIDVLQAKGDSRNSAEIAQQFQWAYFMPATEQPESVQLVLGKNSKSLSKIEVKDITLIDAAMGSGHVLIYAFDVFMQIYESEGYSKRDATKLIIQKNLFGFDIDTRAFQLAYFSLSMHARAYSRRFLTLNIRPNVFDIPDTGDLKVSDFDSVLENEAEKKAVEEILNAFAFGNDLGSLIHFNNSINWDDLKNATQSNIKKGQIELNDIALTDKQTELSKIIQIAKLLEQTYSVGVMNPPYMGSGKMDTVLSNYTKKYFPNSKSDLFSVFMERLRAFTSNNGYYAMITQHAWMFLSSFEKLRDQLSQDTIINMAHLGTRAFEEIGGEVVQSTTFVFKKQSLPDYIGTYERLTTFNSQQRKEKAYLDAVSKTGINYLYRTNQANFSKIPGSPIAYWVSDTVFKIFKNSKRISDFGYSKKGLDTGENAKYYRLWAEVSNTSENWVPLNKGGDFRKWYGNHNYVINWMNNGKAIKNNGKANIRNEKFYFHESISWTDLTSGPFSGRLTPKGFIFDAAGPSYFGKNLKVMLAYLNSKVFNTFAKITMSTMHYTNGQVAQMPFEENIENNMTISDLCNSNVTISTKDYNSFEWSWDFTRHPLLLHIADDKQSEINGKLQNAFQIWEEECQDRFGQLKKNEEELNRIFIDLYNLNDELTPNVADKDVSVRLADEERDIRSFLSYFVGVVFGRYSLDKEGLVFAGGTWNDENYHKFVPNKDNLLLLNDEEYFNDSRDIIQRLKEFLTATFGEENVTSNIDYIASVVGKKAASSESMIRRYFVEEFFKDHKKIYQKRPIYWEFNSGRQNGFKALMYLHRYEKGELAMVRTDYLHALQGQYEATLTQLENLAKDEPIAKQKKLLEKRIKNVTQQIEEVKKYDPLLQHLANEQIELDLDDGVLVNYAKLQDEESILSKL